MHATYTTNKPEDMVVKPTKSSTKTADKTRNPLKPLQNTTRRSSRRQQHFYKNGGHGPPIQQQQQPRQQQQQARYVDVHQYQSGHAAPHQYAPLPYVMPQQQQQQRPVQTKPSIYVDPQYVPDLQQTADPESNSMLDDNSLTTHCHDLHNITEGCMDMAPFEQPKNKQLDYTYYADEKAYTADWFLSNDINETDKRRFRGCSPHRGGYRSNFNNGIEEYRGFYEEYQRSYYENMLKVEAVYAPNPRYMEFQQQYSFAKGEVIMADMRLKVVDWLLEVQDHFYTDGGYRQMIASETFHLAVTYLDRYLSNRLERSTVMQEIGITAMFLASKYIDYQTPSLNELQEITDNSVKKAAIRERERDMLKAFTCTLSAPTAYHFLIEIVSSRYLITREHRLIRRVALYFCDFSRLFFDMLAFPTRVVAVACLFLAYTSQQLEFRFTSREQPMQFMNVRAEELVECIRTLNKFFMQVLSEEAHEKDGSTRGRKSAYRNLYVNLRWSTTILDIRETSWSKQLESRLDSLLLNW